MYHRLLVLAILTAAVACAAPEVPAKKDAKQPDYYPLKVGHEWEYDLEIAGMKKAFVTKLTKTEKVDGKELFLLEAELDGAPVPLNEHLSATAEGVFRHKFNGMDLDKPLPILKLPYKAGETWTTKTGAGGMEFEVKATAGEIEEITVPAGKYKAAQVTLELEQNGMKVTTTYWFAADVGVVSQSMSVGGVEFASKLKKFTPAKADKK